MAIKKDTPICGDIKQLKKIIKQMPQDKQYIGEQLAKEIVFMAETLQKLKQTINENGCVELFEQGKQKFTRECPALKSYNTTIQRYSLIYKQFINLIPTQAIGPDKDALLDFISRD